MAGACHGGEDWQCRRDHTVEVVDQKEKSGLNFDAFESNQVHFRGLTLTAHMYTTGRETTISRG